jgi:hypothetical protein
MELIVPEFPAPRPVHPHDLLEGCRFGRFFFGLTGLEPLLEDGGQGMPLGVFRPACPGAIAALNALGFIDPDAVCPQPAIMLSWGVFVVQKDRCAVSASGAFVDIDKSGLFAEPDLQVPLPSLDVFYRGTRMDFDVDVPADLDQFRRNDSHGAVIGRKSLIQLRHSPANGRALFHKVDVVA